MPMPSARTKYILSWTKFNLSGTKLFCLRQNILSMAKKFISALHKSLKMTSFVQKLTVSSGRVIFLTLYVAEMNFLAMDKMICLGQMNFVPDKFDFVWDKIYFVLADGTGIRFEISFQVLINGLSI